MRIAILYPVFGQYHLARFRACLQNSTHQIYGLEVCGGKGATGIAGWRAHDRHDCSDRIRTLFPSADYSNISAGMMSGELCRALEELSPDVVAIPGWADRCALLSLQWCLARGTRAILMSASTADDEQRSWWKERIKSRLVRLFSAALVGGTRQRAYAVTLGIPANNAFVGYDVVDNAYFDQASAEMRKLSEEHRAKHKLPRHYFLASTRFLPRKNLVRLITAFAQYRRAAADKDTWKLVLLGDGVDRRELLRVIQEYCLEEDVLLPGFVPYQSLALFYGLAEAFIHASLAEQWGLVVNEAMASGLPVLVSDRCGCAADLVRDGVNGFTFDPYDVGALARLMSKVSTERHQLSTMGIESRRIIADWGPQRFVSGLKEAAESALSAAPKNNSPVDRLLIRALLLRSF